MTYQDKEKLKHLQDIFGYDVDIKIILDDLIAAVSFYTGACPLDGVTEKRVARHYEKLAALANPE